MEFPPDAFRLRGRGVPLLSVEVLILPVDVSNQRTYRFSRDGEGRVREFPFLLGPEILQAELSYHGESLAAAALLRGAGGTELLNFEVLEREDSRPFLIRVSRDGTYFFVFIQKKPGGILEAWYDEEGLLLEAYDYAAAPHAGGERIVSYGLRARGGEERRYYDSRGLVTGVSGPGGDFSVLYYLEDLPLYWDCRPAASPGGAYSFRWDEKTSLLLGVSGEAAGEDQDSVDFRYDYALDEQGGWIERREIRLIRRLGLLTPSPGTTVKRVLKYGEEE
jgi:hypothetical protein